MKLKSTYNIRKRKICIELETTDFTEKESLALNMLGEPVVIFQKTYPGDFTISLSKKIRSEFKVVIRIDGTENVEAANLAAQQFMVDIKEKLVDIMEKLMDSYADQTFPPKEELIPICEY